MVLDRPRDSERQVARRVRFLAPGVSPADVAAQVGPDVVVDRRLQHETSVRRSALAALAPSVGSAVERPAARILGREW